MPRFSRPVARTRTSANKHKSTNSTTKSRWLAAQSILTELPTNDQDSDQHSKSDSLNPLSPCELPPNHPHPDTMLGLKTDKIRKISVSNLKKKLESVISTESSKLEVDSEKNLARLRHAKMLKI